MGPSACRRPQTLGPGKDVGRLIGKPCRNEASDSLTTAGDQDFIPRFHRIQQGRQMGLGFRQTNGFHDQVVN